MPDQAAGGVIARLRTLFPEREFFMRSQGQVRFIRISSRLQIIAALTATLLLAAWIATMASFTVSQLLATRDLLDRQTRAAAVPSSAVSRSLADLSRRQDVIDKMVESEVGELPAEEGSEEGGKISAVLPGDAADAATDAAGLARIEARQLAFVARLTRLAEARSASAAGAIRALGLDPEAMIAQLDDKSAQGGPLQHLATAANGSLDPRFRRLGMSLARMGLLERGLAGIPHTLPAAADTISSGFGYRADPFNGEGAFHAGLDFKGAYGAPIYAAAKGTVSFVGQRQGYGNCIEIDHGNGLVTRYAHMSAFRAAVGQTVPAGAPIGAIGNSGRSTGPHLHFEVRIDDQPVNPRPFLEAGPRIFEGIRHAGR